MIVKFLKRWPKLTTIVFLCLGLFLFISTYERFGDIPKGTYLTQVEQSPQYDRNQAIFVNRRPDILDTMDVGKRFLADPFGKTEPNFLFNDFEKSPTQAMPEFKNADLENFTSSKQTVKFIWLGHSTLLLSLDDVTILIDPIFSDHASPFPIAAKRFQPPTIALTDLPEIDYIIISHDHYDHLDMATVKHFADSDVQFFAPLGVGAHLRHWGIAPSAITELDWWEEADIGELMIAATPSQHFSGRKGFMHNNKSLWASWIVKSPSHSVFFSGDSGYDTHYKKIGEAYGPFDVVFMENGQYNEAWRAVHNLPDEVITAFQDVTGRYLVPIHWGMFDLAVHNWYDPANEVTRRAKAANIALITPRLGQVISLENPPLFDQWWLEIIDNQSAQ